MPRDSGRRRTGRPNDIGTRALLRSPHPVCFVHPLRTSPLTTGRSFRRWARRTSRSRAVPRHAARVSLLSSDKAHAVEFEPSTRRGGAADTIVRLSAAPARDWLSTSGGNWHGTRGNGAREARDRGGSDPGCAERHVGSKASRDERPHGLENGQSKRGGRALRSALGPASSGTRGGTDSAPPSLAPAMRPACRCGRSTRGGHAVETRFRAAGSSDCRVGLWFWPRRLIPECTGYTEHTEPWKLVCRGGSELRRVSCLTGCSELGKLSFVARERLQVISCVNHLSCTVGGHIDPVRPSR